MDGPRDGLEAGKIRKEGKHLTQKSTSIGENVQGGPSGCGKPPVDLVPTVLAAAGPVL